MLLLMLLVGILMLLRLLLAKSHAVVVHVVCCDLTVVVDLVGWVLAVFLMLLAKIFKGMFTLI